MTVAFRDELRKRPSKIYHIPVNLLLHYPVWWFSIYIFNIYVYIFTAVI